MWKASADTASEHKQAIGKHDGIINRLPGIMHDEIEKHLEQRDKRLDSVIVQLNELRAKQVEYDEEIETIKRHDYLTQFSLRVSFSKRGNH